MNFLEKKPPTNPIASAMITNIIIFESIGDLERELETDFDLAIINHLLKI
jgi:hypothetical protein